jgi:tetratricopeptide (TPR) repeat protein
MEIVDLMEMKIKFYKFFCLLLLLFGIPGLLSAQWALMHTEADSLIKIGTKYIYNVQFDSATICFNKVIKMYPNHPVGYFMDAMAEWWKIRLFRETEKYDDSFLKKIDKVLDVCDKRLDSNLVDITALFFQGGAYGYRGRFHAIRKNYLKVANDGRKGYEILTECWKLAPGNHDIQLGTGIYNYFVVAFPEEYPVFKPLITFFPKGDKTIGILQLKSAAKYARYAQVEAEDVLLQIFYQFEENYNEALPLAEELYNAYPNNPYFHRYLGRCYTTTYNNQDKADEVWREIIKRCIKRELGYDRLTSREALFYVGQSLMWKQDFENSLKYFYKCDEASRYVDKDGPSGFMVKTNLYIGKIFDLQGKRKYAKMQYEKILKMKDYDGSQEAAKKYLEKPYGK